MKRRLPILILSLLVIALAMLVAYPRFKKIEKRGPAVGMVSATLPSNLDSEAATIRKAFNNWADFVQRSGTSTYQNKFPEDSKWSRLFLFSKSDPVFPTDQEILLDRGADSFVARYVQIPSERRTHDLYLYEPTADFYWNSEYFYDGQPAKFRCSFLIHLEPAGNTGTKVEVFEYQPTIWVGRYLGLSAHAIGPAMLSDIRSAEATTSDRQELLSIIIQHSGTPAG